MKQLRMSQLDMYVIVYILSLFKKELATTII